MAPLWWVVTLAASVVQVTQASPVKHDVIVTLNTLRWQHLTGDKFLSLTMPYDFLLTNNSFSATTVRMLKGLSPAYLRVEGLESANPTSGTAGNSSEEAMYDTESQLTALHQLAADTGLTLVLRLCPEPRVHGVWDPSDALHKISIAHQLGLSPVWQLGYEMPNVKQTTELSGRVLGRDVCRLRKILDSFPLYQRSALLGPDGITCNSPDCGHFLSDFLLETNDVVGVVTLQMKPHKNVGEEDLTEPADVAVKMMSDLESLFRLSQKQVWIAENGEEGYTGGFFDALLWGSRLGFGAKLGYQTILHRPMQLTRPSPDYWVSLLYRTLVGRAVLSARLVSNSSVSVFAHCSALEEQTSFSVLDPEWEYEAGAVTVWGVNMARDPARVTLQVGSHQEHVHLYILTADNWDGSEPGSTLLNGQLLNLIHGELPQISPRIRPLSHSSSVIVPGQSVFFIVLPDLKARACLSVPASERFPIVNKPTILESSIASKNSDPKLTKELDGEENGFFSGKGEKLLSRVNIPNLDSSTFQPGIRNTPRFNTRVRMQQLINGAKEKIKAEKPIEELKTPKLTSGDWSSEEKDGERSNKHSTLTLAILRHRNIDGKLNSRYGSNVEEDKKLEKARYKRSEDEKVLVQQNNPQTVKIPSLYRRIHLLQQKRGPLASLSNVQKSNSSGEVAGKKSQSSEINEHSSTNTQGQEGDLKHSKPTKTPEKSEPDHLYYLPGEFYETLGDLKLDSNVSLKDIEDPHEAIPTSGRDPSKCKDGGSRLKVSKKRYNEHHVDSKVIENATEQMKQYYRSTDVEKHLDFSDKTEGCKMKCHFGEKKLDEDQSPESNQKEDTETSNERKQKEKFKEFPFQTPQPMEESKKNSKVENIPFNRMKREIDNEKEVPEKSYTDLLKSHDVENSTKTDYSDELQVKTFLEELTSEGEQLLKSVDQRQSGRILESRYDPGKSSNITTLSSSVAENNKSSVNENNVPAEIKKNYSDFYLRNNLLTNITLKPKRKYPSKFVLYSKFSVDNDTYNDSTTSQFESDNSKETSYPNILGKPGFISKSSEELSDNKPRVTPSVLEELNNSTIAVNSNTDFSSANTTTQTHITIIPKKQHSVKNILDSTGSQTDDKGAGASKEIDKYYEETNNTSIPVTTNLSTFPTTLQSIISTQTVMIPDQKYQSKIPNTTSTTSNGPLHIAKTAQGVSTTTSGDEKKNSEMDYLMQYTKPISAAVPEFTTSQIPIPAAAVRRHQVSQLPYIDRGNGELKESDDVPKPTELFGGGSPSLDEILLSKHKERLETFKVKLEKARERLLKLTNPQMASFKMVAKREIPLNQRFSNDVHNKGSRSSERTSLYAKHSFDSLKNNGLATFLEDKMLKSPLTYEPDLESRLMRQVSVQPSTDKEEEKSLQESTNQPQSIQTQESNSNNNKPASDIAMPTYSYPLNKWIIPLSNYTENIVLNNKMFPVKLYGILSDDWLKQSVNEKSNDIIQETQRQPRSIQYPCIKDKYNDFESEEDKPSQVNVYMNVKRTASGELNKRIQQKDSQRDHKNRENSFEVEKEKVEAKFVSQNSDSTRSKRSLSDDIHRNEMEMKALLTNEILKEGSSSDMSAQEHSEGAFGTMLRQTLSKAVSNKTGIERMFELAKQYQKTNPTSLEIFKDKERESLKKNIDSNEDENKAMEVTDHEASVQERVKIVETNATVNEEGTTTEKSINENHNSNSTSENQKEKNTGKTSLSSKKGDLTAFINKIQEFFKQIAFLIKKSVI